MHLLTAGVLSGGGDRRSAVRVAPVESRIQLHPTEQEGTSLVSSLKTLKYLLPETADACARYELVQTGNGTFRKCVIASSKHPFLFISQTKAE